MIGLMLLLMFELIREQIEVLTKLFKLSAGLKLSFA